MKSFERLSILSKAMLKIGILDHIPNQLHNINILNIEKTF
jgi:hypothetical protein